MSRLFLCYLAILYGISNEPASCYLGRPINTSYSISHQGTKDSSALNEVTALATGGQCVPGNHACAVNSFTRHCSGGGAAQASASVTLDMKLFTQQ